MVLPEIRRLQSSHQARVKAHKVQLFPRAEGRIKECLLHFRKKQGIIIVELVAAVAPQGTAAVIPADQRVVVRRIIVVTEVEEGREGLLIAHVRILRRMGHDALLFSAGEVQHVVVLGRNVSGPLSAPAGIDEEVGVPEIEPRALHFPQVLRGRAVTALKIRAHHIDHDRVVLLLRRKGGVDLRERRIPGILGLVLRGEGAAVGAVLRAFRRASGACAAAARSRIRPFRGRRAF